MSGQEQLFGSVTGDHIDINAAVQKAMVNSDHGARYKLDEATFYTGGFFGITTSVVLSSTPTTSEDTTGFVPGCSFDTSAVSDVHAWINMMPGSPPSLHVIGKVDADCDARVRFLHYEEKAPPNLVIELVSVNLGRCRPSKTFHYTQSDIWIDDIKINVPSGGTIVIPNKDIEIAH